MLKIEINQKKIPAKKEPIKTSRIDVKRGIQSRKLIKDHSKEYTGKSRIIIKNKSQRQINIII